MNAKKVEASIIQPPDNVSGRKRRRVDAGIAVGWSSMQHEIEAIREYVESIDSICKRDFRDFGAWVDEQLAGLSEAAKVEFCEHEAETAFKLTQHFPEFTWQTTFVAIYSFLEDEMLGIARMMGRRLRIEPEDPEEIRDKDNDKRRYNGIFAAQKYLNDLCGIAFPERMHPWQEVRHYNRLRNAIVHSRGHLNRAKNAEKTRHYVQSKKSVTIDSNSDRLQLSKDFCLEVLGNVEALLDDLFKLARDKLTSLVAVGPRGGS